MSYCTHGHATWFIYRAKVNNVGTYGSAGALGEQSPRATWLSEMLSIPLKRPDGEEAG